MKNTIFAATLVATTIASNASAMSAVNQARMSEFMESTAPHVELAIACKIPNRFEYMQELFDFAYLAFGENEFDRDLIEMQYQTATLDFELQQNSAVIKNNRDHAEIVEACNEIQKTANASIAMMREKSGK